MSITVGDERKTSTINNLPLGFYYYLIPKNRINSATYLGFVDTIQSLTFNPFIEETDINSIIECTFNSDRYGIPDGGIPKCYRIDSFDNIEKEIGNIELFEVKQKYESQELPHDPKLQMYPFTII